MLLAAQSFCDKMNAKDVRYTHYEAEENRNECIRVSFNGEHGNTISFSFFFDADGTTVDLKVFTIAKVPDAKLMDMYVLLNNLNSEYRWVKFYLDSDNEVTASGDAVIDPPAAGEELYELMYRYLGIIDDIYPRLMKVIWG